MSDPPPRLSALLACCFFLIERLGAIAPWPEREDWRREWRAEVECYWDELEERGALSFWAGGKLLGRCLGAALDTCWLRKESLSMSELTLDVRYVVRAFGARPGFSAVLVLTLALGIGANTAIFSLIYGILLRPFPYREPDRLVRLQTAQTKTTGNVQGASIQDLDDWRASSQNLAELAGYITFDNLLNTGGAAESVRMTFVSPQVFKMLGVSPVLGDIFRPEDDRIGGETNKAALSHHLWQSSFGGDPQVIGRVVELRGARYTIVGVMPPGFRFPDRSDVWTPLHARYAVYPDGWWKPRDVRIHNVIARLKDGVNLRQAQSEMSAVAARLEGEFPTTNQGVQIRLVPLRDAEVGDIRPYLLLLVAAVALVLLICCANVANLLLARAATREREMAIRAALGAGRLRLMRLLLTESLLLALAGASCGLGLAYPALQALLALIPVELPFWMKIELDWRALAFSLAAAVLTSLLFGLAPAWQSARVELSLALKNGAKGTGGGAQRLRSGLIVAEIAFSLLLLLGAGLMMQSFLRLLLVDPGIKTERLLTVEAGRFVANTNPVERAQGYINPHRRALARLAQLPGVVAVSGGNDFPYRDQPDQRQKVEIAVIGQSEREQRQSAPAVAASTYPGYFNALGIPLYAGRDFNEADNLEAARVAIVSRRAAGSLWPGREAVGQMIRLGKEGPDNSWSRVVGVVGDTKWQAAEQGRGYEIYFPYLQGPGPGFHYLLRVEGDPQTVASALRQAIKEAAPELAVTRIRTMDQVIAEALWQRRLWGVLFAAFAGVALLLASVGVYGVMSYLVNQRAREFGVRVALGARPLDITRLVVGQGMKLTAIGLACGLAASFALARLISSMLFGVTATDPLTYGGVSLMLAAVAFVACYLPARRASRVDPMALLRAE